MSKPTPREKRVKRELLDVPIIGERAAKIEREKALKALAKAKEVEQQRLANGFHWITDGKTRKLVKR